MLRSGAAKTPVVDCSAGLTIVDANPHLWLDPQNARHYVARIRDGDDRRRSRRRRDLSRERGGARRAARRA